MEYRFKNGQERALVDATLTATGTSGIFNQTADEMDVWMDNDGDNRLTKKEPIQKKKSYPTEGDEKSSFTPSSSNLISDAQRKKIFYDADKKGVKSEDIEAIIRNTKKKPLSELTKNEASGIIDWLAKISQDDCKIL